MKRFFPFLTAVLVTALCALSCTQEIEGDGLDSREKARPEWAGEQVTLTATIDDNFPETKTQLSADGKFLWSPNDQINLIYGSGYGSSFISTNTEPAATAQFTGNIYAVTGYDEEAPDLKFWGIYPYWQSNYVEIRNGTATAYIHFPYYQMSGENTWGQEQFVYVGQSNGLAMGFRNLCGGFKFYLERDDITEIRFKSNDDKYMAGKAGVRMVNGIPTIVSFENQYSYKEICLFPEKVPGYSGTFKKSEEGNITWYYMAIPPRNYSNGVTFTFYTADGQVGTRTFSSINAVRNQFVSWEWPGKALDRSDKTTFTDIPTENNQIIYYAPSEADLFAFNGGNNPGHENDYTQTYSDGKGIITRTDGQDITEIPDYAFCYSEDITSVILPETVTTIGTGAFASTALTRFTIPESVTTLGVNPFADCQSLTSFSGKYATVDGKFLIKDGCLVSAAPGAFDTNTYCDIPEGVTTIGNSALAYVTAKRFLLAESITTLENGCFRKSKEGQKNFYFVLPESVTSIGSNAFKEADINAIWCSNDNLPTIQSDSFGATDDENTTFLIYITGYATMASNDLLSLAGPWFYYRAATNSRLRVGQDTDEIWYHLDGNGTMWFDSDLNFGSTSKPVHAITGASCVFYTGNDCSYFTPSPFVKIPFDLTSSKGIGVQLFDGDVTNIPANAFKNHSGMDYMSIFSAETIGDYAFYGNTSLLCFPVSRTRTYALTSIGEYAFTNCSSMAFPNANFINLRNVTSLGVHAFSGCVSFGTDDPQRTGSILLLGQVPAIPNYAFNACKKLTHIEICNDGNTDDAVACITSIGGQAFSGCENLVAINSESLAGGVDVINLPGVTNLAFAAFYECKLITDVTLGAVTKISNDAFHGCTALKTVTLNAAALKTIETSAFNGDLALVKVGGSNIATGVLLPAVTSVGTQAFSNTAISSVSLPAATSLGASAFSNCGSMANVNLPNVTIIPTNCFLNCSGLSGQVNIPAAQTIQEKAFYGCTTLLELILPDITLIGDRAFGQTRSLTNLEFGPGLTTLGAMIFYDESTDNTVRNYDKLEITFSGLYPTSLYSAFDGTTPTFAYTNDAQNLFMPKKVYVPEDFYDDYHSGFADDWDQWISEHRLQMYRPE